MLPFERPIRPDPQKSLIAVSTIVTLVAVADVLTGRTIWLGPFYLFAIMVAELAFGWRVALGVAVSCMLFTNVLNGFALDQAGGVATWVNLAIRVLTVLLFIGLLEGVHTAFAREWRLARTDPLTGALNRQAFSELVAKAPDDVQFSLLAYIDLDGLKQLNDRFGHSLGDQAIATFATQVRKIISKGDIFARLGGDEFVVCMAIPDEDAGKLAAKRLHVGLNAITSQVSRTLGCSIGALISPNGLTGMERQLRLADGLMYRAKKVRSTLRVASLGVNGKDLVVLKDWGDLDAYSPAPRLGLVKAA
jgi:diguanylate cyclase (GGDEF)-like protein